MAFPNLSQSTHRRTPRLAVAVVAITMITSLLVLSHPSGISGNPSTSGVSILTRPVTSRPVPHPWHPPSRCPLEAGPKPPAPRTGTWRAALASRTHPANTAGRHPAAPHLGRTRRAQRSVSSQLLGGPVEPVSDRTLSDGR
jgi:hypothetical protein